MTWLVVGLGNPGSKYEHNRHNIGFRVVDELARGASLAAWKPNKLGGDATTGMLAATKCVLLKPMEFMNLSGFAVQRTADFHAVEPAQIIVVHDEIDLDFGIVRIKTGGGHGGHNGLRSIIEQLGKPDFARVRMGVGRDPNKPAGSKDAASWVLADFPKAQATQLTAVISAGCEDALAVLTKGVTAAMNQHNGRSSLAPA
ncbi:MAG TPA: aminoacyl-tRNA hydrolase [Kofleriaceae bacterium]|jgi:PTH1 family peptidyl-tRNA hydrolase|nr:aminoacyl-tRNA hydrolase [Kofleriaceae bacterium]